MAQASVFVISTSLTHGAGMSEIPSWDAKNFFCWDQQGVEELAVFELNQRKHQIISGAHGRFIAVFCVVPNARVYSGIHRIQKLFDSSEALIRQFGLRMR